MKKKIIMPLSIIVLLSAAESAFAVSVESASFKIKFKIESGCLFDGVEDLEFGVHTALTSAINEVMPTTFRVICSNSLPFKISFNEGLNGAYIMKNGSNKIKYTLYRDSRHRTVIDKSTTLSFLGDGKKVSFSIFGAVDKNQKLHKIGQYKDTVTMTASY